ncbi:MAG: 1-acyl-sn-glycerol-3-phosphate acyltransferase [Gammaproteobacteria bacterium]|nr:1-acyl-sn-glycerol-3-phosphate acyltransferase [Gammaproteobacteria bacterium]
MNDPVVIPLWALLLLILLALPSLITQVLIPLWLKVWNRWSRRTFHDVNPQLQLKLSPFTLTRYRALANQLATDPQLLGAAAEIAEERGMTLEDVRDRLHRIALEIVPAFNPYFYFRVGYRLGRSMLRGFYRIAIGFVDEASLETVSNEDSVIFMSNHRTNMDYLLVTYLTSQRTMLSFGVGEWSGIFPIRQLMRSAGGYFIRRDSNDPLYRRALERYVQLATAARVPHAIFPEGALSPDGGLQQARFGLFSFVTKNFDPATSPDIVVVPIGTNYDRVAEDTNMVRASSAEFRARGRSFVIWSGIRFGLRTLAEILLQRRSFGYACANFGRPLSFRDWLRRHDVDWPTLDRAQRFAWLNRFGEDLMAVVRELIPVPPVATLCWVMRQAPATGLDKEALLARFREAIALARKRGAFVVVPRSDDQFALQQALELTLLRGMIRFQAENNYRINPDKQALVAYYAKSIEHHFEADVN